MTDLLVIFDEHARTLELTRDHCSEMIVVAAEAVVRCLEDGCKVILCGNGGSAADCQHVAAEIIGHFETERRALPALSLATDTSVLTAVMNDYGYADVFRRQVDALAEAGDVVIGISTSGNSENVVEALRAAGNRGCTTIGLTGDGGGKLRAVSDICIQVPSSKVARIQEMHALIGHMLCAAVDDAGL